jgi:hypothetical protein
MPLLEFQHICSRFNYGLHSGDRCLLPFVPRCGCRRHRDRHPADGWAVVQILCCAQKIVIAQPNKTSGCFWNITPSSVNYY